MTWEHVTFRRGDYVCKPGHSLTDAANEIATRENGNVVSIDAIRAIIETRFAPQDGPYDKKLTVTVYALPEAETH